jgi:hypothetical protein
MGFHWQNLNESKKHPRWGGGRRHGRAWLTLFEREGVGDAGLRRRGIAINWCWTILWDASCAIAFSFVRQEGTGISLRIALPWLFDFYLTLLGGPFAWLAKKVLPKLAKDQRRSYPKQELPIRDYGDRELFNLYWYDWAFWWNFWRDPMGGWSSRDPKWHHGSFHIVDFIFGRTKYAERALEGPLQVKIPMPERAYDATLEIQERTWRRKRWPGVWRRWLAADFDSKQDPIPSPGKGENSWDCGEDATYGLSTPCPTGRVEDAIGAYVATVMNNRRRHGSLNWAPTEDHRPKPGAPAAPPVGTDAAS